MNIYITNKNLLSSAQNLDNRRLRNQLVSLLQILCNILHTTDLYACVPVEGLLPLKNEKHAAVEWGRKTPLHTLFILDYFYQCSRVAIVERSLVHTKRITQYSLLMKWREELYEVLPFSSYTSMLLDLDKDLYRGVTKEFDNEPDTIEAYKKYLSSQWKKELMAFEESKDKVLIWDTLSVAEQKRIPKPRLTKKLVFSGRHTVFVKEQLKKISGEIKDARRIRTAA